MQQRILLLDDDPLARLRMRHILQRLQPHALCAEAGSLSEARDLLGNQAFQLALVDIGLPDGNGIAMLEWMRVHAPATEAVVLSGQGDTDTVLRAIRAGAVGYLHKAGDDAELEMSLASMERGGAPIDPVIARRILLMVGAPPDTAVAPPLPPSRTKAGAPAGPLSGRELQVLGLVAQGCGNAEIAEQLFLSVNTVACHTKSIYRKLAVRSRSAAVHSARIHGLLT